MSQSPTTTVSRRRFLKTVGATALAAGAGPAVIIPGRTQPKTLRILQIKSSNHVDHQRVEAFAKNWGERNDIAVTIDWVKMGDSDKLVAAEAAAHRGHDIVRLLFPVPAHEDQFIDHREIYRECQHRYGKVLDAALKSSYNPKTGRFWCFVPNYTPHLVFYRKDLWDQVGITPDSWEDILQGGRQIKFYHERPLGISFAHGPDSEPPWRALLYSFGASVQDADGFPILKSGETLETLEFARKLYAQTMSDAVLSWDGYFSNNQAMLKGEISLTTNTNSITRSGERKNMAITDDILLAPLPQGPVRRLGPANVWTHYGVWKFAENVEAAKQYLVDAVTMEFSSNRHRYPCFPEAHPDYLEALLSDDPRATPADKYKVVASSPEWTTNVGYPGHLNAPIGEIYNTGLIPAMFANAASGKMTPQEALTQADQEVRKIF